MNDWPFDPSFDELMQMMQQPYIWVPLHRNDGCFRHLLTAHVRVTPEMQLGPIKMVPLLVVTAMQDGEPYAVALNPCLEGCDLKQEQLVFAARKTPLGVAK